MHRMHDGQTLLLAAVDEMTANLARQDLDEASIPALVEATGDVPPYDGVGPRSFNLYVPTSALERAREVLENVGGPADLVPLVKSGALGTQAIETPPPAAKSMPISPFAWIVLAVLAAIALVVFYLHSN